MISLVVAILCFIAGWMSAKCVKFDFNNKEIEQTATPQERASYLDGGMSYEKDQERWNNYKKTGE